MSACAPAAQAARRTAADPGKCRESYGGRRPEASCNFLHPMFLKRITTFINTYSLSAAVYVLVGGASALIEWASFYVCQKYMNYVVAAFVAFVIATSANYVLSRKVAFRPMRAPLAELVLLFLVSAFAFLFNLASFVILYAVLGVDIMASKVIGTGFGFAINFSARQFLVFSSEARFPALTSVWRSRTVRIQSGAGDSAPAFDTANSEAHRKRPQK
jgi:putative flippase GtrA